jgi:ABC-type multidrug transport system fused ATPase/permease subunit
MKAFAMLWVSNRWLGIRIDLFGALITLSAALSVLYAKQFGGNVNAGSAGLSITYALSFSESLLWIVRLHAMMEMEMNAVERIGECDIILTLDLELPEEADAVIPGNSPSLMVHMY